MIGFPTCSTCGGFGSKRCGQCENDQDGFEDFACTDPYRCPSCVEGVVITDELVEAFQDSCRNNKRVWALLPNAVISEALAAVVSHLKETTSERLDKLAKNIEREKEALQEALVEAGTFEDWADATELWGELWEYINSYARAMSVLDAVKGEQ